jgi:hypothetical protein
METHAERRRRTLRGTIIVLTTLALAPVIVRAEGPIATTGGPNVPFKGCYYYEHTEFKGERREIPAGVRRNYVGDHWNDKISSIACSPGCSLQVWEYHDFTGASRIVHPNSFYVGDACNDDISHSHPSALEFCD